MQEEKVKIPAFWLHFWIFNICNFSIQADWSILFSSAYIYSINDSKLELFGVWGKRQILFWMDEWMRNLVHEHEWILSKDCSLDKRKKFRQIFRERKRGKLAFATLWMKQSCLLKRESTFHYKFPVSCKPEIHTLQTKLLLFLQCFLFRCWLHFLAWLEMFCHLSFSRHRWVQNLRKYQINHSLDTGEWKIWENIQCFSNCIAGCS